MEMKTALKGFLDSEDRLTTFPAKRKKKLFALFYLAELFEPGRTYTEREVNDLLRQRHTFNDPATLRRELYDFRFLDRSPDGRVYTVSASKPTMEEWGLSAN